MKFLNGVYYPENNNITMISTDGSLKEVRPEIEQLKRAEGWMGITNARRSYYIEHDRGAGGSKPNQNIIENLNENDVLPGGFI